MLKYILLGVLAFSSYYAWTIYPITYGPGVTATSKPTVERITWEKPFNFKKSTIEPIRKISGEVRILDHKRYFLDNKAKYSPVDILIGWQELSDERNIDHLHFSLQDRFMNIGYSNPPLPLSDIYSKTALWHLIPSSEKIDEKIKGLKEGNIISIEGFIVNIKSETYFDWNSEFESRSMAKPEDSIIWVNKINVR